MKITLVDLEYSDDCFEKDKVIPTGEPFEVTEEEYEIISQVYTVRIVMDKDYLLNSAKKTISENLLRRKRYEADKEKRKARLEAAAEKRKLAKLEKLKKELGVE
jgi:hypothetical protein